MISEIIQKPNSSPRADIPVDGPLGGVKRRRISGCTKQTSIQFEDAKIREELTYFVDSIPAGSRCSIIRRRRSFRQNIQSP